MRRLSVAAIVTSVVLAAMNHPSAQETPSITIISTDGARGVPAVSGQAGYVVELKTDSPAFLYKIEIGEMNHQPCGASAYFWREAAQSFVNTAAKRRRRFTELRVAENACGLLGIAPRARIAEIPGGAQLDPGDIRRAMVSAAVCLGRNDAGVRGLELSGAFIQSDGRIIRDDSLEGGFKRLMCGPDFEQASRCGPNRVATGIDLHFEQGAPGEMSKLIGVKLHCSNAVSATYKRYCNPATGLEC